jgi:hypothetical protein
MQSHKDLDQEVTVIILSQSGCSKLIKFCRWIDFLITCNYWCFNHAIHDARLQILIISIDPSCTPAL